MTKTGFRGLKFYVICKGKCAVLLERGDKRNNIIPKSFLDKFNSLEMFDLDESDEENE